MLRSILLATSLVFISLLAGAQVLPPVSVGWANGVAIGGKDTVAYHSTAAQASHQAVPGNRQFRVEYLGVPWYFASQASADRFAADPAAFVPQYNGHCANGLSLDEGLIRTDGAVWEFFGDKLYLFYSERGRQRWLTGDWQSYRRHADQAWQVLVAQRR
jgi:YHS domain-containing protein